MKWVTRHRIRVNRVATAWLIRRFVDRSAVFAFGADFPAAIDSTPESAGLRAISRGFPLVAGDDHEVLERAAFLYDSLHAHLAEREGRAP